MQCNALPVVCHNAAMTLVSVQRGALGTLVTMGIHVNCAMPFLPHQSPIGAVYSAVHGAVLHEMICPSSDSHHKHARSELQQHRLASDIMFDVKQKSM